MWQKHSQAVKKQKAAKLRDIKFPWDKMDKSLFLPE